ncbi:hypothetical protein EVAR_38561_1 [Eumeta japonica]|uniref:Uncharacterized protein n=1 Tax=Eumeta variegata TaxID=151549 RepID=A0A4C1WW28_EUMVA|nr:hypothetical protein EVAR_38561_1 [Eumeta japonica]
MGGTGAAAAGADKTLRVSPQPAGHSTCFLRLRGWSFKPKTELSSYLVVVETKTGGCEQQRPEYSVRNVLY